MATLKVTDEIFEEQVLKSEKPVLVDFGLNGVDLVKWLDQF